MKFIADWWFPDHEEHFPQWMLVPKNKVVINGRCSYQGRKQLAVLQHLGDGPKRLAVDVGGHVGTWSFNLAKAFERVVAFEPVEDHRACFVANVPDANVELLPYALGKEPGLVTITTTKGSSGDSKVTGAGSIEMRTLDSFEFQNMDLGKLDAEGYEENILRGAEETIKRCKPLIIVEQKRDMAAKMGLETLGAVKLLQSWGYRVVQEYSGDYIMKA